uniref:Solute carrier family 39 member 11 n=1 Tax=Cyanistes caeruleus TaxID=156563 RepID=A0A8C0TXX6_CYACU
GVLSNPHLALLRSFPLRPAPASFGISASLVSPGVSPLPFCPQVMLAASYWSLLAPAIELAEESGAFGAFSFFPVAAGFALGAAFVYGADLLMPVLVSGNSSLGAHPSAADLAQLQGLAAGASWGLLVAEGGLMMPSSWRITFLTKGRSHL